MLNLFEHLISVCPWTTVFIKGVIPAPYQVRGKLQPESRVPGENRDPVFEMVPDFRRDGLWMPDRVRHDERTEFMERH
jgi:hypothetical protein